MQARLTAEDFLEETLVIRSSCLRFRFVCGGAISAPARAQSAEESLVKRPCAAGMDGYQGAIPKGDERRNASVLPELAIDAVRCDLVERASYCLVWCRDECGTSSCSARPDDLEGCMPLCILRRPCCPRYKGSFERGEQSMGSSPSFCRWCHRKACRENSQEFTSWGAEAVRQAVFRVERRRLTDRRRGRLRCEGAELIREMGRRSGLEYAGTHSGPGPSVG